MRLYRRMLAEERNRGARAVPALSTGRLLTMSWLEGTPFLEAVKAPRGAAQPIARNMFRAWYVPFYDYGVIHGDPHLGNYTGPGGGALNLLDFGAIRIFQAPSSAASSTCIEAVRGDEWRGHHAYESWGFPDLGAREDRGAERWANFLYAPLLDDRGPADPAHRRPQLRPRHRDAGASTS